MKEESSKGLCKQGFEEGDIVWAKITGYPWWPATITKIQCNQSTLFRVDFIADRTQYFIQLCLVLAYQFKKYQTTSRANNNFKIVKKTNKQLNNAYMVAEQRYSALKNHKQLHPKLLTHCLKQQQQQNQFIQTKEEGKQLHFQLKINVQKQQHTSNSHQLSIKDKHQFVNDLLKRYNLDHIPKTHKISKKNINTSKSESHLLIRKIYQSCKEKGMNNEISRALAAQLGHQLMRLHTNRCRHIINVLRWIRIATFEESATYEEIIEKYNDRWDQSGMNNNDKEKPSNMTTYQ